MSKKKSSQAAGAPAAADDHIRLSTHPAAAASVKRSRARCGLAGFGAVLLLSMHAGVPGFEATERALAAGIVAWLGAWLVGIYVWRQVIRAQVAEAAEAHSERRHRRAQEAVERAAEQMGAQSAAKVEAAADWAATIGP